MAKSGIHWLTPATVLSSFIAALFLAVGHHLFYASLAGSKVPTGSYNFGSTSVSRQQLNIAFGTAFAFLVTSAMGLCIGTSYIQLFWHAIRTSRKGEALRTIDAMHRALSNLPTLFRVRVWWPFPLLFLSALISWCIPIIAVVTPASLTVESIHFKSRPTPTNVSAFDFTSLKFVEQMNYEENLGKYGNGSASNYSFVGPSPAVKRIVTAVLSQGQILPIMPPSPNSSWVLSFWGPSLQCSNVSQPDRDAIWASIWNSYGLSCFEAYGYLGWTAPGDSVLPFDNVPVGKGKNEYILRGAPLAFGKGAALYLATMPFISTKLTFKKMSGHCFYIVNHGDLAVYKPTTNVSKPLWEPSPGDSIPVLTLTDLFSSGTFLRCTLMNSSQTASFDFVNGRQNITVLTERDSAYAIAPSANFSGPANLGDSMTLNANGEPDDFDPSAVRLLAYQGMAAAFNNMLTGYMVSVGQTVGTQPGIYSSILLQTEDLQFMSTQRIGMYTPNLQYNIGPAFDWLGAKQREERPGSLIDLIPKLFEHFVISLLSEPFLQPDYSSPYAPLPYAPVVFSGTKNIYIYSSRNLWLAYGLALFFVALTAIMGLTALLKNQASYNNDFSTILRVGRGAELSTDILEQESDGRQPLPKRLTTARLQIPDEVIASATSSRVSSVTQRPKSAVEPIRPNRPGPAVQQRQVSSVQEALLPSPGR